MDLLEREQYLTDLAQRLQGACERHGRVVLIGGEAGIGKTALLQEFAARRGEARILWGGCDALFTPRPLAPLHDIAQQAQGALLARVNSSTSPSAIFTAVLDELGRSPTLLVLEDLHWADEATLDLLKYLARRIERTRTLLVATYRDDEVGERHPLRFVLGDLPRTHTDRIWLAPLSEAAVAQLARQAGRAVKDLHSITGGNPLFVTEVLAAGADAVPASVCDAVLARAARLSPPARAVAELVSVVPGRTEAWLLEQVTHPAPTAIDGCLSIGMVRHDDGAVAFRHELARRAFEDALPPLQRQQLHHRVLTALATHAEIPAARLAHHADGARLGPESLRYAAVAATQAAALGAHREAAAHYQVALRYAAELPPAQRARLHEQLAYERYLTGEYRQAIAALGCALQVWRELAEPLKQGAALGWLSKLTWFEGDSALANRYATDAIRTLESLPAGAELAQAYCFRADLEMEAHEVDAAIDSAQRAIALAQQCGNNELLCDALKVLGTARLIGGQESGWTDLNRCLQIAMADDVQEQVASAYCDLAAMAVSRRQYELAAGYLGTGLRYSEERDLDFCLPFMLAYRARLRFEQGDWNGASEDVQAVLRHGGSTPIARIPALRTLAHLRIRRGDPDCAGPIEEARALAGPAQVLQRVGMLALVCAEAAWLAGDCDGVIRVVAPVYERARLRRDPRMNGELAAWLWRAKALAAAPAEIAEPYAMEINGDWQGAANAWKTLGCPYEHASLLAWYGAEAEQREALVIFERLGASPAAHGLRKRMREHGVRRVPRGARSRTRDNRFGLTRREAQILELLCEGQRSAAIAKQLFIAPKTVEHHVAGILAKLGVSSRVEAVALARKPDAHLDGTHRKPG